MKLTELHQHLNLTLPVLCQLHEGKFSVEVVHRPVQRQPTSLTVRLDSLKNVINI